MPSYRLEEASTSRAGCQNKECKDQKVKIQKGELRHGTWVENDRIKAFMWRHWGCVTPKIISNLNETIEELSGDKKDPEAIDGFEDLSPENQERVVRALEQGHIDDEEWKGDVEMNRPGKVGFRVRGGKKAAAKDDESEEEPEPKTKKRGRAQAKDEDKEAPAPKPKKARKSKTAVESDEEEEELSDEPKPKKTRGRPARAAAEKKAPKKAAKKKVESEEEAESPEEKPKRGRKKKSA
ncbi:poly polymerase and DNA-ligase Zn-finger region-domain-containing protein [Aspergillus floccosus]